MPVNMYWVNFWRLVVLVSVLSVWQWGDTVNQWLISGFERDWRKALTIIILEPFFISKPTEIWARFLDLACFTDRDDTWSTWSVDPRGWAAAASAWWATTRSCCP